MSTVITVRAVDETPAELRHLDGRTFPIRPTTPTPAAGVHGSLFGIPGVLVETPDSPVWEIRTAPPTPELAPPWAQALAAQLDEIRALLVEIRDRG